MAKRAAKILIVDDDADILANFSDILCDKGYQITTASSGPNALDQIQKNCPANECCFDLCLLDFKMPEMDGAELLEHIRQRDPSVRAIMITAFVSDNGIERAKHAGTISVVRKPVEMDLLLEKIANAIE